MRSLVIGSVRTACAVIAMLLAALPAAAAPIAALRVMLHPYAAERGSLPPDAQATLEALAGTPLALTGTTRTGALELALPAPVSESEAAAMVKALRVDRSVLWAEAVRPAPLVRKSAPGDPWSEAPGNRLLVRLKDGVVPDWAGITERMTKRIGLAVTVERQIGNVWVLSVALPQSPEALAQLAAAIQDDPDVQYADPVRRVRPAAAPNDPWYPAQWSLNNPLSGINVETAWTLQPTAAVTVAVIDTGILPHPDLVGRVLGGYDFISDPGRARDGNARDPDPRDEGDWSDGNCDGATYDSFFHGLFVAGQIAANTNNGIGIAGVAAGVRILPVRTLGACGGTFEDVLEGMLWSSGVPIAGVPANTNPARVINMSLGGFGACDQSIQEAIDDALAHGAVVVVAAGNASQDVTAFSPANCSGVITVGAHDVRGNLASYSNFGPRVDVSAPGGDLPLTDLIVSLGNDGETVPKDPTYTLGRGTSFATPLVAGTAAMLIARDPLLTAGRVLDVVTGSARLFPPDSECVVGGVCGAGMLDAGAAVGSVLASGPAPANAYRVVEYYRADLDHYFITADPAEIHYIDTFLGGIFQRTGLYFYAYLSRNGAPASVRPVCRFYADANVQINSHWYSASTEECLFVLLNWPGIWKLEKADAFYIQVPDAIGNCPAKTLPVYRFFNLRNDANHRYTVDLSQRRAMANRAWAPEGYGVNNIVFCSPI
ncbi:MAG: S8 family peptidase [Burkholderiales bacterium]